MKKSKSIILGVPKPCTENWDKMTPNEKGRHCSSCDKTVIDFSNYTDKQLFEFISNTQGRVCGRLSPYQVNRPITVYEPDNNSVWQKLMWGTALASSLAACNNDAEKGSQPKSAPTSIIDTTKKAISNTPIKANYINGIVLDDHYGTPIEGAAVFIKEIKAESLTNKDGLFSIELPDNMMGKKITVIYKSETHVEKKTIYTIDKLPFNTTTKMSDPPIEISALLGDVVCVVPRFNGGINEYIQEHLEYPKEMKDKKIQGTVYVRFMIDTSGAVENVKILRGVNPVLDSAAVKVISTMPNWVPTKQKQMFNIPIRFVLGDTTSNAQK